MRIKSMSELTRPSEEQIHIAAVDYLKYQRVNGKSVQFFHVPNQQKFTGGRGGNRGAFIGYLAKLKKMGVSKGVPDLIILTPPPKVLLAHGAMMEFKRGKGGTFSPEQLDWRDWCLANHWEWSDPKSVDEAIKQFKIWGYAK